jgi:hypothetical protein
LKKLSGELLDTKEKLQGEKTIMSQKSKKESLQEEVIDTPEQLVTYANRITATITGEDAFIHFGQRTQSNPAQGEGVAKIYMNLLTFKSLVMSSAELLKRYEAHFGEIVPPSLKEEYQTDQDSHSEDTIAG